jgi:hypothetical protein
MSHSIKATTLLASRGTSGQYIDSLTLTMASGNCYGSFGGGGGTNFSINVDPKRQVVGFVGRAGEYLDALGLLSRQRC